jgi:hypothetical protein
MAPLPLMDREIPQIIPHPRKVCIGKHCISLVAAGDLSKQHMISSYIDIIEISYQ